MVIQITAFDAVEYKEPARERYNYAPLEQPHYWQAYCKCCMPKPPINLHHCNYCCVPPMCTTHYMPPCPCMAPIWSYRNCCSPCCTNTWCPKRVQCPSAYYSLYSGDGLPPDRLADPLVALEINPGLKEIYDEMYGKSEESEKEIKSSYMPNEVEDTSSTNSDSNNSINAASRKTYDISNDTPLWFSEYNFFQYTKVCPEVAISNSSSSSSSNNLQGF